MTDAQGLEVRGLAKHFGGVQAVKDVNLTVQTGECVALIGPNGAGKSTTFACIAGQHRPSAGLVLWNGVCMNDLQPLQRLQYGLARTFQVAQTFEALSVLHNVQMLLPGAPILRPWARLDANPSDAALKLLERVGLLEQRDLDARSLPYGAKKRLELAMALAGLEPQPGQTRSAQLLLLDEPAAGLGAAERASLMQLVHGLTRSDGALVKLAVLYTEHNMDAVFGVADRVLVLMEGRIVAAGSPQEIASNALVQSRYLGQSLRHLPEVSHA